MMSKYSRYLGEPIGDFRLKYLKSKCNRNYPLPMWIRFIELMMEMGVTVRLAMSKTTKSKYVVVSLGANKLKIRFGNHPPRKRCDADLLAGMTRDGDKRSTASVVNYVIKAFGLREITLKRMPESFHLTDEEIREVRRLEFITKAYRKNNEVLCSLIGPALSLMKKVPNFARG